MSAQGSAISQNSGLRQETHFPSTIAGPCAVRLLGSLPPCSSLVAKCLKVTLLDFVPWHTWQWAVVTASGSDCTPALCLTPCPTCLLPGSNVKDLSHTAGVEGHVPWT